MLLGFKVKLPSELIANDFLPLKVFKIFGNDEITASPKIQSANLGNPMDVAFTNSELIGQASKGPFKMRKLNYCLVAFHAHGRHIVIDNVATLRELGQNQVYLEIDYPRLRQYEEQNRKLMELLQIRHSCNHNDIISALLEEVKNHADKDIAVFYKSPEGNIKAIPSSATNLRPTKHEKENMLQELRDILKSDAADKNSKFINKAWEYKDALNYHRKSNHLCNQAVNFFKVADNSSTASWREVLNMTTSDLSLSFLLTQNSIELDLNSSLSPHNNLTM